MFFLCAKACNQVTAKSVTNCRNRGLKGFFTRNDTPVSDDEDEFQGFTAAEFSEAETKLHSMLDTDQKLDYLDQCVTLADDAAVYQEQTDAEIIEEVQGEAVEAVEPEEPADLQPIPSATEAVTAFQTGLR